MKKTTSVTLGGRIFVLEEDAYALLDTYLHDLKTHFRAERTVAELMGDIESSLAERLSDLLHAQKEAITRDDVEAVIRVMGRPEEIAEESDTPSETTEDESERVEKRLYRDSDDVVLAGVSSGLAAYFMIDTLLVRLAFILLTLANGLGLLVYGILWLIVPKAETNAQKLEMRGRPTNISEIQELAKEKAQLLQNEGRAAWDRARRPNSALYRLVTFPVRLLSMLISFLRRLWNALKPVVRVTVGLFFLLGSILGMLAVTVGAAIAALRVNSPYIVSDLPLKELSTQPLYYLGVVSFAVFLMIPLVFATIIGVSCLRNKSQFRVVLTSVLVALWFAAGTFAAVAATDLVPFTESYLEQQEQRATVTRAFDATGFDRIAASGTGRFSIVRGDAFAVSMTGDDETLNHLNVETVEGELRLAQGEREVRSCFFCRRRKLEGTITLPALTAYAGRDTTHADIRGFTNDLRLDLSDVSGTDLALANNAIVTVTLADVARLNLSGTATSVVATLKDTSRLTFEDANVGTLRIDQRDVSRATADGKAQTVEATLQDVAHLDASGLESASTSVVASDASRADVSALERFAATSTDIGRITYERPVTNMSVHREDNGRIEERTANE